MKVYHFWSKTCEPCKKIKPVIEDLKEDFQEFEWTAVDIHNDPEKLTQKYDIKQVPTIVVETFKGITSYTGTDSSAYFRLLKNA